MYFDTETKWVTLPTGDQLHTLRLGWACYVSYRKKGVKTRKRHWHYFTTQRSFYKWLVPKIKPKRSLYVIASNVWFDIRITEIDKLLFQDGFRCEQLYDKNMISILGFTRDTAKVVFISTQNFIPYSVEKIGKLLGYHKQRIDFDKCTAKQLKEYCKVDVEIIVRFLEKWLSFAQRTKMGTFRHTISSQSLTVYRSRFMHHDIEIHTNSAATEMERESYYGGRVECYRLGKIPAKKIYKLDINSQYPYVMKSNYFPSKLIELKQSCTLRQLKTLLSIYCCIATVKVCIDKPTIAYRQTGKTMFPIGMFTTTVCSETLERLIAAKQILEVFQVCTYEPEELFIDYVDFFGSEKEHFSKTGDLLMREFAKKFMNTLYGKWGQKRDELLDTQPAPPDKVESRVVINGENGRRGRIVTYGGLTRVYEDSGDNSYNSFPAICSHVTDYARNLLWDYIKQAGRKNVFYCDTDSLFVNSTGFKRLQSVCHPDSLGMLKSEGEATFVELRGCKDYTFGKQVVHKGIRKNAIPVGVKTYQQYHFPTLKSYLREHPTGGYIVKSVVKHLTGIYDKGVVLSTGEVKPYCLG